MRTFRLMASLTLAAAAIAGPTQATGEMTRQTTPSSRVLPVPLAAAMQEESLVIGPGDGLHLLAFGIPELEQHLKVSDAGTIRLPLGGDIMVTGLTPPEASVRVEDALRSGRFVNDPHISITVERYATQLVSVFGLVRTPGAYPLDTPRSVVDVLSLAGGLAENASRHIVIKRHATGEEVGYTVSNSAEALLRDAPMVQPGDTVVVPRAPAVYMVGDVNRPGTYVNTTTDDKLSVLHLLALAGSTPPTASPSHARLVRKTSGGGYTATTFDLSAIQKGHAADFPLEPDDVIYIPYSYLKNVAVSLGAILAAAASASVYQF